MKQLVYEFLRDRCRPNQTLLLALSGGPDSLALFHVLLAIRDRLPFKLAVAHIDHRWRETSTAEAAALKLHVESFSIPFHLKVLDPQQADGNLEQWSRNQRHQFFRQLMKSHGYHSVLLGHHADDQAETVLKRLFEGRTFVGLMAMQPENELDGLLLWRPLLKVTKKTILQWLNNQGLSAIDDDTNRDTRYLRGRCRESIIPLLNQHFGKDVTSNFCRISTSAKELSDYLDHRIAPAFSSVSKGPFGYCLDLSPFNDLQLIECRHLIYRIMQRLRKDLSHQELDSAAAFLLKGKANCWLRSANDEIFIDRRRLFILNQDFEDRTSINVPLQVGCYFWGSWQVIVQQLENIPQFALHSGWKKIWQGNLSLILPQNEYFLQSPQATACYPGNSLIAKLWSDAKVPIILRHLAPVIAQGNRIIHEFASGRTTLDSRSICEGIYVQLQHVKLPVDGENEVW